MAMPSIGLGAIGVGAGFRRWSTRTAEGDPRRGPTKAVRMLEDNLKDVPARVALPRRAGVGGAEQGPSWKDFSRITAQSENLPSAVAFNFSALPMDRIDPNTSSNRSRRRMTVDGPLIIVAWVAEPARTRAGVSLSNG